MALQYFKAVSFYHMALSVSVAPPRGPRVQATATSEVTFNWTFPILASRFVWRPALLSVDLIGGEYLQPTASWTINQKSSKSKSCKIIAFEARWLILYRNYCSLYFSHQEFICRNKWNFDWPFDVYTPPTIIFIEISYFNLQINVKFT